MRKITFVLGSLNRGGAERVISVLANDYAEKGWQVDIILLLSNKIGYDLNASIRVLDLTGKSESRIKRLPYWLKELRFYFKKQKPDICLAFAARINILVQLATMGLKLKTYVSERNDPKLDGRGLLVRILTCLLYPHASGVIFQTKRAARNFPKLKNAVIIPNPIQVNDSREAVTRGKIVYVGRLSPQKNPLLLLEAFAANASKHPEYYIEMFGDGELIDSLKKAVDELGIVDRVNFAGNVKDIHKRIADASFFVLSSDYEGLSNALLEAMVMGIPCISTNCAGADEYIVNGKNGLLTEVGNVDQMSRAMDQFMTNDDLRKQCGENARQTWNMVSKDVVLSRWHSLMD